MFFIGYMNIGTLQEAISDPGGRDRSCFNQLSSDSNEFSVTDINGFAEALFLFLVLLHHRYGCLQFKVVLETTSELFISGCISVFNLLLRI